jgi:hypothetical protein
MAVVASAANQRARSRTLATVLAREKMEELMAAEGIVSPGVDYANSRGEAIGGEAIGGRGRPQPAAIYVRQWSSSPLPSNPSARVLHVWVTFPHASPGEVARIAGVKPTRSP